MHSIAKSCNDYVKKRFRIAIIIINIIMFTISLSLCNTFDCYGFMIRL